MLRKNIYIVLCLIFSFSIYGQETEEIDSYIHIIEAKDTHDTVRISYLKKWDNLIYYADPELDQELNERIIAIAERNVKKGNLSEEELKFYHENLLSAYNIVGINLDNKGYYWQALNNYYEAIKYARKINDREREGAISNNIGLVHELQGNKEKALDFYILAEQVAIEFNDTTGMVSAKNNLGSLYSSMDLFDSSKKKYKESILLAEKAKLRGQLASSLQNLGVLYEVLQEFDSALVYYDKCVVICEEDQAYWEEHAKVLYNIGSIYSQMDPQQLKKAIAYCNSGMILASEYNARYTMFFCATCLYKSYKDDQNLDSSFKYLEIANNLSDSLKDNEKSILIAQKDSEFEYQEKSIADSIQKREENKVTDAIIAKKKAENEKQTQQNLYLIAGVILLTIFGFVIYSRLQITKRQKALIILQKKESDHQKEIIAEQHTEITDSINYAEMIQQAVLPTFNISDMSKDSFILFKPKDKVSGDFYWLEDRDGIKYYAVGDCTGHGIPGAFISMIGTILINEIFNSKNLRAPNEILSELSRLMGLTLTDKKGYTMRDGMDISFVAYDEIKQELQFSGANNPVWIISNSNNLMVNAEQIDSIETVAGRNLFQIKGDSQPVGKIDRGTRSFTCHTIALNPGDSVYLFSDGYADQFGGPSGKKLKYKPMRKLLLSYDGLESNVSKSKLEKYYNDWKGDLEQIDDVCIINFKV
jgi:serine phosphatase RsbU (regulator of sigma subunit)